jgi:NAD(P)-dependent dehydrogenase (short-subunit alcohol dehydrogenase family)
MSSYQSSKSAVNRFTEFIHFEYEDEGVRTFAFHPGLFLFPELYRRGRTLMSNTRRSRDQTFPFITSRGYA